MKRASMETHRLQGIYKTCLVVFVVLGLSACANNEESKPVGQRVECIDGQFVPQGQQGIIGGAVVSADSWLAKTAVVLYMQEYVGGKYQTYSCSGTLIGESHVLTAAHCVLNEEKNKYDAVFVSFTHLPTCDRNTGKLTSKSQPALRTVPHPGYLSSTSNLKEAAHDVAIIKLSGPAPSDYRPSTLAPEAPSSHLRKQALVAGFGRTLGSKIEETSFQALRATKIDVFDLEDNGNILVLDNSRGKGVCKGDSGGAAFAQDNWGRYQVIGVASKVGASNNSTDPCHDFAIHTAVAPHRTWIESTLRELGGFKRPDSRTTPFAY